MTHVFAKDYKGAEEIIDIFSKYFYQKRVGCGLPRAISVRKGAIHEEEQDAGANAWFAMAGAQLLYNKPNYTVDDQNRLQVVLSIADYLLSLQNTDSNNPAFGGIRSSTGSGYYPTEFSISSRAALEMVAGLLRERGAEFSLEDKSERLSRYERAIKDIEQFLKNSLKTEVSNNTYLNLELWKIKLLSLGGKTRLLGVPLYTGKSYYMQRGYEEGKGWDGVFATDLAMWSAMSISEKDFQRIFGVSRDKMIKDTLARAMVKVRYQGKNRTLLDFTDAKNRAKYAR